MLRLKKTLALLSLLSLSAMQGCAYYPASIDFGKQLSISMVRDNILVIAGHYGNSEGLVQINSEARLRAAEIGRSMGYEAFQVIHEAGAEFSNAIVGAYSSHRHYCDPTLNFDCSVTSQMNGEQETGYGYSPGGYGSYRGYYNWGRFVEDAPIHHSSWKSSPLYAEDGYRYRLVVRFVRYDSGKMPSHTFNINDVLQASGKYRRSHLLDPYWNTLERR